jgi:glutamate-ammonia-ligase adenylyltransferase
VQIILAYLAEQQLLEKEAELDLIHAYHFLRTTEHRLQQVDDRQTHHLPENEIAQAQLAYGMGFESWSQFSLVMENIRERVHQLFSSLLASDTNIPTQSINLLQGLWQGRTNAAEVRAGFTDLDSSDTKVIISLLGAFRESLQYRKLSKLGVERLDKLIPLILKQIVGLDEPVIALQRTMKVIESILRRSVYMVLLIENARALAQLIKLCAASQWITELISHSPALLDEFLDARMLYTPLDKAQLSQVLAEVLSHIDSDNLEQYMEVLRYFKHSQMLKIAVSNIDKLITTEEVSTHLTWLAELVLQHALQAAWALQTSRYGIPRTKVKIKVKTTADTSRIGLGYGIIGFGKLGSGELNYSSDLDLVFIVADDFIGGETDIKKMDNLQFFGKLSLSLLHILQTRTASGRLYEVDMRLRPNGQSGLITSSLKGFYRYQIEDAWTWEHQALIRARWIAGDPLLQTEFEQVRKQVLQQYRVPELLQQQVRDMRLKMRKSLAQKFHIKHDFGGLVDIEFMVQFLVLKYAHDYPQLLTFRQNYAVLQSLRETGLLADTIIDDLSDIYGQFTAHLQQMSLQGLEAIVPGDEFKKQRKIIQQHWHAIMGIV